jgi:PBP1b-binding outer membrane lipoprotein LpoB
MKKVIIPALIIIIFMSSCTRYYSPWDAANKGNKAPCHRKQIR